MDKILIDSDAFFALYQSKDPHHEKAARIYNELNRSKIPTYSTNLVVYETATLLSYRISQLKAVSFLRDIFNTDLQQIFVNEALAEKALSLFLVQTKKRTSFVDCANAVVMKELKIDKIFSFDEFYKDKRLTA